MSKLIRNSSHGEGPACLAFSKDGSHVYTGGQDMMVRIWRTDLDDAQEPFTASEADDAVTSVAAASDCWISGSLDADVRRYPKHRNNLLGLVTNVGAVPVRSVAFDSKGRLVAVASDELEIKVVDIEDIIKVHRLSGHTRGVRKVTWHPSRPILTSCGSDGNIIVWDLSGDEPETLQTIEGIIPAVIDTQSSQFAHDCSAVWHPSGEYFFVSSRAHEVVTISKDTWTKTASYSNAETAGAVTALAVSVNGEYLASAVNTQVHVWSVRTRNLLFSQAGMPDIMITQLAFSPSQNLIAWIDSEGAFSRWKNPVPSSFADPVKVISANNGTTSKRKSSPNLFGDDNDNVEMDINEPDHLDDENWIIDDMEGAMQEDKLPTRSNEDDFVKEMVSITKAQPPFQPGSTPMINKKRYLAYTMVGVIEVTDQDVHHIVSVDFFDRSLRKGYHFTDHHKYDLGYIGERGVVLACQPENDHPAQVVYKPYGTWTSQVEWTYSLDRKGTKVLGVASGGSPYLNSRNGPDTDLAGSGDVIIATSEGDLTFLSGTGRERRIIGLGGEFVSMVAGNGWVFVVHRAGSTTIDGSQNLVYSLVDCEDFGVIQRDILPVPKGHTLKWIGVTQEGAPAMFDSTGCVHVLTKFRVPHHASWARVLDTNLLERRQGKDESYWPVGIVGSTFMCLILKGRQEHPSFPRPLVQELPINLPFRRNEVKDELVARELLLLEMSRDDLGDALTTDDISKRELAMDREFIPLIQAACKADNIPRAIELAKLLHHTPSFDMAVKVAEFYHLVGLKEKIERLKSEREAEDRLAISRARRQEWARAPPVRQLPSEEPIPSSFKPFSDFGPPPTVYRPGLARATPQARPPSFSPAPSTFNDYPESDSKRKRDEDDDMEIEEIPKRRALPDQGMEPPKPKANPFARKTGQDSGRNPFSRKAETGKTIQKSESFFQKVDAAETESASSSKKKPTTKPTTKPKDKSAKDAGPRQTTLFGLPGAATVEKDKKLRGRPKKANIEEPELPPSGATVVETETQPVDESEEQTQPVDSPDEQTQIVETQTEESQIESQSQNWEAPPGSETQTAGESQLMDCKF